MTSKHVVTSSAVSCLMTLLAVFAFLFTTGSVGAEAPASSDGPDGAAVPASDGRDLPEAALAEYYFHISGEAFTPLSLSDHLLALGDGCVWSTGEYAELGVFTSPLALPPGATIESIRIQFYDVAPEDGELELIEFTSSYGGVTLKAVHTNGSSGWGFVTALNVDQTVDYYAHSYGLHWRPEKGGHDMMLCGVRIRYTVPITFNVALPNILNNNP